MNRLRSVTISELSRNPKKVLDRVAAGERLIVYCHKRALATLQPLDGVVIQPNGDAQDIYGWPVGSALDEAHKLTEGQQELLVNGVWARRLKPVRICPPFDLGELVGEIEEMELRGLVLWTRRGWELTGRGTALREVLVEERGEDLDNEWPRVEKWEIELAKRMGSPLRRGRRGL